MSKKNVKQVRVVPESCGKRRYASERHAIGSALACSRKRGTALRVYSCPTCKGWHLTKRYEWTAPKPTGIPASLLAPAQPVPTAEPIKKKARFNIVGHQVWCKCPACAWLTAPAPAVA